MDAAVQMNARGLIRPVDNRRDLGAVADLVELCFSETLDPDSQTYLAHMRAAARASRLFSWTVDLSDPPPNIPVTGFVWEVDGRLVGNLSLIPFKMQRQKLTLIANVAVHPEYRRRGIARQLTTTALDYLKRQGKPATWLHVRSDNPNAIHLYETLVFVTLQSSFSHELPRSVFLVGENWKIWKYIELEGGYCKVIYQVGGRLK
mgnify:CR=1 FL=1